MFRGLSRRLVPPVMLFAFLSLHALASAQQLKVEAFAEKERVSVGEPFLFQIHVEGSESPDKPDISGIHDFSVQELGGQQNSSQSVTIINGKFNREVREGYIFSYRLTTAKEGVFTIPSITVTAAGKSARTPPITIQAAPPTESADFKLRLSLSESEAYVGQPIQLTVTWYVARNVQDFAFNLPVLSDKRFTVIDLAPPKHAQDLNAYVRIPVGGEIVFAERGRGSLDGSDYTTVRFQKVLIPRRPGDITLPQATVSGKALKGYQRTRSRSPFEDMFSDDFLNFGRNPVFETAVAPSNQPRLKVLPLPEEGRPADFSGLIGRYSVSAQAQPTDVSVGDPITLSVRISGPHYLENVELPPLGNQAALTRDFKVPAERAAGVLQGAAKVYTQTIRPKHSEVTQVPPIEFSYFDPETGAYSTARTDAIPLAVRNTRVITAVDAEGLGGSSGPQAQIESREGGIAYNYEGLDALENQVAGPVAWLRSPLWILSVAAPPLAYFVLLAFTAFTRRREDPARQRSRRAFREFLEGIETLRSRDAHRADTFHAGLLQALRQYLGSRLDLPPGALTFPEVERCLREKGVDDGLLQNLRELFERCEAGRYGGITAAGSQPSADVEQALDVAGKIERSLK